MVRANSVNALATRRLLAAFDAEFVVASPQVLHVEHGRYELIHDGEERPGAVGHYLNRLPMAPKCRGEEARSPVGAVVVDRRGTASQ